MQVTGIVFVVFQANPFGYNPIIGLAIASTAIFGFITIGITVQTLYYRTWYFIVLTIVGMVEVAGYSLRCSLAYNVYQRTPYIIMLCFIILAPIGMALADYILVGKLIRCAGRRFSIVDPRCVEWAFIASDITAVIIQGGGAALLTSDDTTKETLGSYVLIGGLAFNLVSFMFFGVVTGYLDFNIRQQMKRTDTMKDSETSVFASDNRWQVMFYALYGSIILLIIRSIYRITEFSTGFRGYVATNEVFFHVFDTLPIAVALGVFVFMHPGRLMPKSTITPTSNLAVQPRTVTEASTSAKASRAAKASSWTKASTPTVQRINF